MIDLYVQNSFCLIRRNTIPDDIELHYFMYNYFTSSEVQTKFLRGGRRQKSVVDIKMYQEVTYEGVNYYQVPKGLVNVLPDSLFSNIVVHDYSNNNLIVPTPSYSEIANSLNPYASFPHLRKDQVTAVSKILNLKNGLLQLPTGCFTGDTEVILENETVRIEDLVDNYQGKKTISIDQSKVEPLLSIRSILSAHETKKTRHLIEVRMMSGSTLKCTPEHPFMTVDGSYTRASSLSQGDILMPYSRDTFKSVDDYSWYLVKSTKLIDLDSEVPVYDLEVDTDHNFVVKTGDESGVVVHNSGKTEIMASSIKFIEKSNPGTKILVIEPTGVLRDGTSKRFNNYHIDSKVYNDTRGELTSDVTVAHTQALLNDLKSNPSLLSDIKAVYWDECFTGDTPVLLASGESVPISTVYEDDSINEVISLTKGSLVSRRIIRKIRKVNEDSTWIKIHYMDPLNPSALKNLVLTKNHPVLTNKGFIRADAVRRGDQIYQVLSSDTYKYPKGNYKYTTHNSSDSSIKVLDEKSSHSLDKSYNEMIPRVCVVTDTEDEIINSQFKYNLETEIDHNYVAGTIIVSNCHHLQSNSWNTLNMSLSNVEYNISLSALAIDKDNVDETNLKKLSYPEAQVLGVSGKMLLYIPVKYYIDRGYLARPVVIQLHTDTVLDAKDESKTSNWSILRKEGIESSSRTKLTCKVTHEFTINSRKVLILVGTKKQGNDIASVLGSMYSDLDNKIGILYGGNASFVYKSGNIEPTEADVLSEYADNKLVVMIATSHMDEGVDIKNLDAVILAGGGKKPRKIIQRVGRALRKTKNGKFAYIIDFSDDGKTSLKRQSEYRLSLYSDLIEVDQRYIFTSVSFDRFKFEFKKLEGLNN